MIKYKVISCFGRDAFENTLNEFKRTHDVYSISNFQVTTTEEIKGSTKMIKFIFSIIVEYFVRDGDEN